MSAFRADADQLSSQGTALTRAWSDLSTAFATPERPSVELAQGRLVDALGRVMERLEELGSSSDELRSAMQR